MITFKRILKESQVNELTTVYHGTSLQNFEEIKKLGHFNAPLYVTTQFDVAKEFATYVGGEKAFKRAKYEYTKTHYDGDWRRFADERQPESPKGKIAFAYEFFNESTPVILELLVDLSQFYGLNYIETPEGAYTYGTIPSDAVVEIHELSWDELLSTLGLTSEQVLQHNFRF